MFQMTCRNLAFRFQKQRSKFTQSRLEPVLEVHQEEGKQNRSLE